MSAKNLVEDAIVASITADEPALELGVPVLAGQRTGIRPQNYVAAIADEEDSISPLGGVYRVRCRVVCVAHLDEPAAMENNRDRAERLMAWLGPDCPLRTFVSERLVVKGVVISGSEVDLRGRRQGQVIGVSVAAIC